MLFRIACLGILAATPLFAAGSVEEALEEIATQIVVSIPEREAPSLAVSTFTHSGNTCSDLSNYASEAMVPIISGKGVTVYTRNQLAAIFREESLTYDGTISPNAAQRVGEIAGVEAILTATLIPRAERMVIIAQLVDTADGRIIGSSTSNFPISPSDAVSIEARRQALCGFVGPRGAPPAEEDDEATAAAPSPTRPEGGVVFKADVFEAEIVNLIYEPATGKATWSIRFRNTGEARIGLSYVKKSGSATNGLGGVMALGDTWSGLRVCDSYLNYCTAQNPQKATTLASGGVAQLTFDTVGAKGASASNFSLTFEVVLTPDAASKEYEVRSVGFFDLAPTIQSDS